MSEKKKLIPPLLVLGGFVSWETYRSGLSVIQRGGLGHGAGTINTTDVPPRSTTYDNGGKQIERAAGADDQNKSRKFWEDDDDDPTGNTGDGPGAWNGFVDSDFDAMIAYGGVALVVATLFVGAYVALRSRSRVSFA